MARGHADPVVPQGVVMTVITLTRLAEGVHIARWSTSALGVGDALVVRTWAAAEWRGIADVLVGAGEDAIRQAVAAYVSDLGIRVSRARTSSTRGSWSCS
ncbi:hypothetical protein CLV40_13413 [Actinokineospora auranticolor]|uniref:Uncharacterized protein n=1 Tax=Actinokineospora auranticolor TaxID=155976 RepID=A0A2S6GCU2_9PSEU|nr:hypothetical protein CLV40_13413 [Actinokineospora auranticolor]